MKQQLGIMYTDENPISYIISNRLVQLQQEYGGVILLSAVLKCKKNNNIDPKNWCQIHIINLMETYGKTTVSNLYDSIYSLDFIKKTA